MKRLNLSVGVVEPAGCYRTEEAMRSCDRWGQGNACCHCGGINAFIKGFLKSTDSILELINSLDQVVKDYWNNEVTAQFYSTYYTPVLTTGLDSIELFASKVYTRAVFREVKKQIKGVANLLFRSRDSISTTSVYQFSKMGKPNKIHKELYDPNEEKIECECSMWNSEGIPCSYIFYVMKYKGLEQIPKGLIMSRWCKDAKDWSSKAPRSDKWPSRTLALIWYPKWDLQRRAYHRFGSQLGLSTPPALKDPPVSKTKGAPRKGKEVEPEPGRKCEIPTKRQCCTSCGVHGHMKRTCTWHRAHHGPGTKGGMVPGCAECSSGIGSAPSATLRDKSAGKFQNSEGNIDETSDLGHTALPRREGATPGYNHGFSETEWNPLMGVGGGGANIFHGGQHIGQFFAS
ncbi:hypothetical protein AHAS_Ahas04G0103600 [Arachis hypogaea]